MCDCVWGRARTCCDCIFACSLVGENSVGTLQYRIAWPNMFMRVCEYGCVCTPTWRSVCGRVYSEKKHIVSVSTKALERHKREIVPECIKNCVCSVCMFFSVDISGMKQRGGMRDNKKNNL